MLSIGGLEQTVPTQASVMILPGPFGAATVISAAGTGSRNVDGRCWIFTGSLLALFG
jgi:hypothetical protein